MHRCLPLATALGLLGACGAPAPPAAAPAGPLPADDAVRSLPPETGERSLAESGTPTVRAGAYRLRMTKTCASQERSESGHLTLQRISAADLPTSQPPRGEGLLLWGQTDLDLESLEACPGRPSRGAKREPIHPGVLVEVLQWNGQPQHQVLLVSTDPRAAKGRRPAAPLGVAMWVEKVDQGRLAGVWCRWDVLNPGEGRWQAELLEAE